MVERKEPGQEASGPAPAPGNGAKGEGKGGKAWEQREWGSKIESLTGMCRKVRPILHGEVPGNVNIYSAGAVLLDLEEELAGALQETRLLKQKVDAKLKK